MFGTHGSRKPGKSRTGFFQQGTEGTKRKALWCCGPRPHPLPGSAGSRGCIVRHFMKCQPPSVTTQFQTLPPKAYGKGRAGRPNPQTEVLLILIS